MGIVVGSLWVGDGESGRVCRHDTLDRQPTALRVSQRHVLPHSFVRSAAIRASRS